jgi:hypothetical protein
MTRARLAVLGALLLAGCSGQITTLDFPAPPPTAPAPATTKAPNLTGVTMKGVPGQAITNVAVGPGTATISGTVVGPAGPVGGAVIEAERLVGDAVGAADVTAQADGTWALPNVLGGRYRVRAWRSPDLALTTPEIFFLNGTDTKSLTLQLLQFNAAKVTFAVAPNPPVVGEPATLAVQVTTQVVDAKGIVRAQPAPGASVQLAAGGTWATADPNPAVTGADGTASWQMVCGQAGPQPLTVVVNATDNFPLTLPPCAAPPSSPSTTVTPATTTTT